MSILNVMFREPILHMVLASQEIEAYDRIQSPLLFQNSIFHKMLNRGFWSFKTIFLRMYLLLIETFFLSL